MNQKVALLFALIASLAMGQPLLAEGVTASLIKVRGSVTRPGESGGTVRLKTGSSVPVNQTVTVGKAGVAVFKIGGMCILKQEPRTSLAFNRLDGVGTTNRHQEDVGVMLQKGEMYSAIRNPGGDFVDYHVTTSRVDAVTRGAIFKITHASSTSSVFVKEGIVEVRYCYGSKKVFTRDGDGRNAQFLASGYGKRVFVHAGEAFIVTDCEGVLRWQTDEELRDMSLFAAVTGSAFDPGVGLGDPIQLAGGIGSGVVLAPEVPIGLPIVSP